MLYKAIPCKAHMETCKVVWLFYDPLAAHNSKTGTVTVRPCKASRVSHRPEVEVITKQNQPGTAVESPGSTRQSLLSDNLWYVTVCLRECSGMLRKSHTAEFFSQLFAVPGRTAGC